MWTSGAFVAEISNSTLIKENARSVFVSVRYSPPHHACKRSRSLPQCRKAVEEAYVFFKALVMPPDEENEEAVPALEQFVEYYNVILLCIMYTIGGHDLARPVSHALRRLSDLSKYARIPK